MMPSKAPPRTAEDLGPRPAAGSCQRSSDTASSSPESGGANGDAKRNGKSRRRKKRSSNLDGGAATEDEARGDAVRPGTRRDAGASLAGLQSECATVWLERSRYERAESLYHAWLASNSNGAGKKTRSLPPPGKSSPAAVTPPAAPARPRGLPSVKESDLLRSAQPPPPDSLSLRTSPAALQAPDQGRRSLSPSSAAPRQSVNGLPGVPLQLLQGVWLDKPQYDRAEAAFYQNLYGSNSSKRPGAAASSRGAERPHGLAEEEEEEEPAAPQGKAEVFHALHPIQEEEEPAEDPSGSTCFLHPDSEPVWTDRGQFHHRGGKKGRRSGGAAAANQLGVNTMASVSFLAQERIWLDKPRYDEAERRFYERRSRGPPPPAQDVGSTSILQDIARARENIQKSLAGNPSPACSPADQELVSRIKNLELENQHLYKVMDDLRLSLSKLESRVAVLETPAAAAALTNGTSAQKKANTPSKTEDDDDLDLFGSEEEDEEAEKLREQRVKEYAAKKSQKPALVAKSSILLDVKPWDDETDMRRLEASVRSLQMDGLLWGCSKLVPVGYGIHKLQIGCVVEDDKVGTDLLEEEILKFDLYVQSVDVAAFNKI
ncbi:uncharacterized protein LOC128749656 isoform X2 [Synchiropus splendidus]|uniref:uncharacterized protein LOC128749656 isoform X2 n=1 Tax=Synchiropus splendidus TaxID=270530 RepID=UPI00237EC5A8|nr:uncharacterized protein LOC128749656 isoform X2 [Synchiropus splendidus]